MVKYSLKTGRRLCKDTLLPEHDSVEYSICDSQFPELVVLESQKSNSLRDFVFIGKEWE
jgi:hypothetical protein